MASARDAGIFASGPIFHPDDAHHSPTRSFDPGKRHPRG